MNLKKAKEILKNLDPQISWDDYELHTYGSPQYIDGICRNIEIEGCFEEQELAAIAYWMKHPEKFNDRNII